MLFPVALFIRTNFRLKLLQLLLFSGEGRQRFITGLSRHADGVYVRGDIHTNTVEGLWSLIKRGIGGVYHSVSPENLQNYLDEYCFRYNRRLDGNLQFKSILERASQV